MKAPMKAQLAVLAALALAATATACGSSDDAKDNKADGGETRAVQSANGEIKVPVAPKRIVTLDLGELDTAVTLGFKPVGTVGIQAGQPLPEYLKAKVGDIKTVGVIAAPDLEAIKNLKPDLILGSNFRDKDRYNELSKIAPTVFTEQVGKEWLKNFPIQADALNKKTEGEKVVADFNARAKELGTKLGDPAAVKVSMMRFMPGSIRLMGKGSFIGNIFDAVGVGRPAGQDVPGFMTEVSSEQVEKADGDVLFVSTYGDKSKTDEGKVLDGALWKTLNAVKTGNVHIVNDDYWMVSTGYTAANKVLDDMAGFLPPKK
jgi:iron complex transport system substrate-binding protein